jgi:hypothetical protein
MEVAAMRAGMGSEDLEGKRCKEGADAADEVTAIDMFATMQRAAVLLPLLLLQ